MYAYFTLFYYVQLVMLLSCNFVSRYLVLSKSETNCDVVYWSTAKIRIMLLRQKCD